VALTRQSARDEPSPRSGYDDQPNRSPWIAQLTSDGPPRPLTGKVETDVVVVGAGIAGVATAFFLLRETPLRVVLLERDRVARGATGRNAGQLTTYFERPLSGLAQEFGAARAAEAQRGIEGAHDLLDVIVRESGATVRVERFVGHMGMFNAHQVELHLRCQAIRDENGLARQSVVVSEEADYLAQLSEAYAGLYTVVPQAEVHELLEISDVRYTAVLSARAGCANSGLLCQQTLDVLAHRFPERFRYFDCTDVERVTVTGDGIAVDADGGCATARHVAMCTNGFVDHTIEDEAGRLMVLGDDQAITGRVAYMTAFAEAEPRSPAAFSYIRNTVIGDDASPYVYVTRRTYDRAEDTVTLTCMGGPEYPFHEPVYDRDGPFPGALLQAMDEEVRPYAQPGRPPGRAYDFHWHGLMGYNDGGVRVVGRHPRSHRLLYNLGCNGVGFLPSIYGGHRVARLLAGDHLGPSIFDPR
jgi:glycine/D-amino acid oxidase-like deaminating enzyme